MEENEDRIYLWGLLDGLMLAKRMIGEHQPSTVELDRMIGVVEDARVTQLLDLFCASVEVTKGDLLNLQ